MDTNNHLQNLWYWWVHLKLNYYCSWYLSWLSQREGKKAIFIGMWCTKFYVVTFFVFVINVILCGVQSLTMKVDLDSSDLYTNFSNFLIFNRVHSTKIGERCFVQRAKYKRYARSWLFWQSYTFFFNMLVKSYAIK